MEETMPQIFVRGRGHVKALQPEGSVQQPQGYIPTRPITASQDVGLRGGCEAQAETLFELWKGLSRGYALGTIASATNLKLAFVEAMADLFEP
jgi:hypothetical protein